MVGRRVTRRRGVAVAVAAQVVGRHAVRSRSAPASPCRGTRSTGRRSGRGSGPRPGPTPPAGSGTRIRSTEQNGMAASGNVSRHRPGAQSRQVPVQEFDELADPQVAVGPLAEVGHQVAERQTAGRNGSGGSRPARPRRSTPGPGRRRTASPARSRPSTRGRGSCRGCGPGRPGFQNVSTHDRPLNLITKAGVPREIRRLVKAKSCTPSWMLARQTGRSSKRSYVIADDSPRPSSRPRRNRPAARSRPGRAVLPVGSHGVVRSVPSATATSPVRGSASTTARSQRPDEHPEARSPWPPPPWRTRTGRPTRRGHARVGDARRARPRSPSVKPTPRNPAGGRRPARRRPRRAARVERGEGDGDALRVGDRDGRAGRPARARSASGAGGGRAGRARSPGRPGRRASLPDRARAGAPPPWRRSGPRGGASAGRPAPAWPGSRARSSGPSWTHSSTSRQTGLRHVGRGLQPDRPRERRRPPAEPPAGPAARPRRTRSGWRNWSR